MFIKDDWAKVLLKFILCLVSFMLFATVSAQKTDKLFQEADQYYQAGKYEKAAKLYLKIINNENYFETAYIKLARSFEKMQKYGMAARYFKEIFVKSDTVDPQYMLEYGQILMKLGEADQARSYFVSYNNLIEKSDPRVLKYISSIEDRNRFFYDSSFIRLSELPINGGTEDINPQYYNGRLYFLSNRNHKDTPTLYDIMVADTGESSGNKINVLSGTNAQKKDTKGFAIVRLTGELIQSVKSKAHYELYRSIIDPSGLGISKAQKVSVDSFPFNICYPTVSKSGSTLIFASDAPDGQGGWDLYRSERTSYGYSRPVPLNHFINTPGNESYPFLYNDSILFFASNGQGGLGGLDLFYVNLKTPTALPEDLGYPMNSQYDEYGLYIRSGSNYGYVVSDRDTTTKTRSDIYRFDVVKMRATGMITDSISGENLKNVNVSVERAGKDTSNLFLADNGEFDLTATPGEKFTIVVDRKGYDREKYYVDTRNASFLGISHVDIGKFPLAPLVVPKKTKPQEQPKKTKIIVEEPVAMVPQNYSAPKDTTKTKVVTKSKVAVGPKVAAGPKVTAMPEDTTKPKINKPPEQTIAGIMFRVQIAASRQRLTKQEIRRIYSGNRPVKMFMEDNWYKYAIGDFSTFFEANELRRDCGVHDAFIAAYRKKEKILLTEAIHDLGTQYRESEKRHMLSPEEDSTSKQLIFFYGLNEYRPQSGDMNRMDSIADIMKKDQAIQLEINGYTDTQGDVDYNYVLATERAKFLKKYFENHGIASGRISMLSWGDEKLRRACNNNCTPEIHQENRRTEIIIYKK